MFPSLLLVSSATVCLLSQAGWHKVPLCLSACEKSKLQGKGADCLSSSWVMQEM